MYSYSENIEIMINDKEDKVIKKLFGSVLSKYQNSLEKSIKVISCIFDCVSSLRYKCHKVNLKHGRLYTDSPTGIKTKKAIINPVNKNDDIFNIFKMFSIRCNTSIES